MKNRGYIRVEGGWQIDPNAPPVEVHWMDGNTYRMHPAEAAAIEGPCEMCGKPIGPGLSWLHNDCLNAQCELSPYMRRRQRWDRIRPKIAPVIFERDGYTCLKCGVSEELTIDHIAPIILGGPDDENNLQTLCGRCNSSKGNQIIDYR